MRSFRSLVALALTIAALTVMVPSVSAASPRVSAASHRTHALHVTKECSEYTGQAGGFCTFTSSNLKAIKVGSKIFYKSAAGAAGLDTDVLIRVGHRTTATGHCALDFTTGLGKCTFWKGTGNLKGFHASVVVSSLGGFDWAWDGTYRFSRHHRHHDHD